MSSPKRAAKVAAKPAAKPAGKTKPAAKIARGSAAARPAAQPKLSVVGDDASAEARRVAAMLDRILVDGNLEAISAETLQSLIAAACRLYRARREAGEEFAPVPKNSISATDVMVTASGLLKAADLAVFELGMWQNWTGR